MKRFITISLLSALIARAYACMGIATDNYYLFDVCDKTEFSRRVNSITLDNWSAYMGGEKIYWFRADDVIKVAEQKHDALMVSYVRNLQKYLKCADGVAYDSWDYPTKDELAQRRQTLADVRSYAFSKVTTRLRSQHALLYMRCNMLLGEHAENVKFWENTACKYIETVYKDMMQNIYAGALRKTGRADEAGKLFAEMGDWNSLMTQYYQRRSFAAIREEYQRDPNSAVLPFLLQDFVNNSQEAVDAANEVGMEGKLFIRNIQRSEAQQMWQFAGQVVSEGKTQVPALWKTAQAWLKYLFGQRQEAQRDIREAVGMEGTERMKDNARIIHLYIQAALRKMDGSYDNWLAGELEWLKGKQQEAEGTPDADIEVGGSYYGRAMYRVVHQVLGPRYAEAGQPVTSLAVYKYIDSPVFAYTIDTLKVNDLIRYADYVRQPAQTPLERCLKAGQEMDENMINDLTGTKYLRLCQWDKAIEWLQKVPVAYYQEKGYAVYAAHRSFTVEPWMKRQWLKMYMEYSEDKWTLKENPKMAFAREVQRMEGELSVLNGTARQQRCYDLAVRYAQAHFTGDCWFLMRDGKSLYDTLRTNETDLAAKAISYLRQASKTSDVQLKEKVLFALTFANLYKQGWYGMEWDSDQRDYVLKENTQSPQFTALTELARFEQKRQPSAYVTNCDEYSTFKNRKK